MNISKITIGTRGSQLSLVQTEIIKNKIQEFLPQTQIDIEIIKTTGDKDMSPIPLDTVGKGWFTKELDKALLEEKIDIAVHSLKDIPEVLPQGLCIAVIPEREDARDVLVSQDNLILQRLKTGAIIGTDSNRRKSQIRHERPDLQVISLRGNVNTRLAKLENGEYDGIILAAAGLIRLGLEARISEYFDIKTVVSSPGQGALAVVAKKNNKSLINVLNKLNHKPTVTAVSAEREVSKLIGGGCKMPIGVYSEVEGEMIAIYGCIGSLDGKYLVKESVVGSVKNYKKLSKLLAEKLLSNQFFS